MLITDWLSTCVISIVRLMVVLNAYKFPSADFTWVFVGPSTWTAVEINIGVVSGRWLILTCNCFLWLCLACLPSLRALMGLAKQKSDNQESCFKNSKSHSMPWSKRSQPQYLDKPELQPTGIGVTTTIEATENRQWSEQWLEGTSFGLLRYVGLIGMDKQKLSIEQEMFNSWIDQPIILHQRRQPINSLLLILFSSFGK